MDAVVNSASPCLLPHGVNLLSFMKLYEYSLLPVALIMTSSLVGDLMIRFVWHLLPSFPYPTMHTRRLSPAGHLVSHLVLKGSMECQMLYSVVGNQVAMHSFFCICLDILLCLCNIWRYLDVVF